MVSKTDVYTSAKGSALFSYNIIIILLTLYKPDTSLRWTLEASPKGVHLRES